MRTRRSVRIFLKHTLNRLTVRLASSTNTDFAAVRHVGRRSGAVYETPIIAEPLPDGFLIALTYGPKVDWYRNVQAAGRCELRWHDTVYTIHRLTPVERETALQVYPPLMRWILRASGTTDFVKMQPSA